MVSGSRHPTGTVKGLPSQLRLTTANPNYKPLTCLAEEAGILGTVLWLFRRP